MEPRSISFVHACYEMFRYRSLPINPGNGLKKCSQAISFRQVLSQLKKDLIGKDSHRGVTLTYTWLANQFGHFSLGFIPSILLSWAMTDFELAQSTAIMAAICVTSFWAGFELFNFLGPLLAAGTRGDGLLDAPKYTFAPAWGNIAYDTVTDVMFFSLGAFVAATFQDAGSIALHASLILGIALIPISYYWYVTKMYQQSAGYPSQIRLGQWDQEIDESDRETVQQFLDQQRPGKHLLVFGTEASGKTALSIALATEKSIKHERCIYVSAMKLFSLFCQQEPASTAGAEEQWSWRNASTLVIDDINPGEPVHHVPIPAQTFLRLISDNIFGAINKQALRQKNVIWVLGTDTADGSCCNEWKEMLEGIGIDRRNIQCINLSREAVRHGRVISFREVYDYHKQSLPDAAGF